MPKTVRLLSSVTLVSGRTVPAGTLLQVTSVLDTAAGERWQLSDRSGVVISAIPPDRCENVDSGDAVAERNARNGP